MLAHVFGVPQDNLFPGVDLFHATEHLLPRLRRIRSVFTLHDLIFRIDPGSHLPLNRIYLNTMLPLIACNLLNSFNLLIATTALFDEKCVRGITANAERCSAER